MLDKLTIDDFRKWLNAKFTLDAGDGRSLELELVGINKMTERELGVDERIPFAVEFRGPLSPGLPQRIYSLENREAGKMDLFLVPVGPDSQGMIYEAVFT